MTMPPPGQWPQPPQGAPQGPPQWNPQAGPPKGGNKAKWILGGFAILVVVVVSVVATLLVTRGSSGSTTPNASGPSTSVDASDVASANDHGPAGIITEDPTCDAWRPIGDTLSQQQQKGWDKRDPSIPATDWSPEVRRQYEDVAKSMLSAADQTVALSKKTPHRVMRELYQQSVAYWRAYADNVPDYLPADDVLALVANSTSNALVGICSAIYFRSAAARSPLVMGGVTPLSVAPVGDITNPERFMKSPLPICAEWASNIEAYRAATEQWLQVDPNLRATDWSPAQQAVYADVSSIMASNAGTLMDLGIRSGNPVFNDFAAMASQYRSAYVQAIPSYVPSDNFLADVASQLSVANDQACKAAAG